MAKKLKVMCVHGLGDHRNTTWETDWKVALSSVFPGQNELELEFQFVTYDPIFENVDISAWESAKAVWHLSRSALGSGFRKKRGVLSELSDRIKWTAGYVVAWLEDETFKQQTRELMIKSLKDGKPDIILAHSLGSLITYNAFTHKHAEEPDVSKLLKRAHYVTLGSQIGNPFVVRNLTPGRIEPVNVKHWHHLYNDEDDVFTAPIRIWDTDNFTQVLAPFDIEGFADHAATEYLQHRNVIEEVWRPLAEETINSRSFGPRKNSRKRTTRARDRKDKRALLVGINDYPNEADKLEGCVNDVFEMSAVLQECGFQADTIRVCLDHRATAQGILDRLEWLLDDPQPGDERIFYYSGHGATVPEYGMMNEPDRLTETLVPWDFDWSPETAVTDDQIFSLYSQLPYDTRLVMIFDCCHSGGMHRDGGAKARGINPPDDIRHRSMKWDSKTQMWVSRDFERINPGFSRKPTVNTEFFGHNGSTVRLGRAVSLRGQTEQQYQAVLKEKCNSSFGPYLPLIIEACQEDELSYEYRHGVTSHGAFTFALKTQLRAAKQITFGKLITKTANILDDLGYAQRPQILGPSHILKAQVPWTKV